MAHTLRGVCCKSRTVDPWKHKEIECIKQKLDKNITKCHQIGEKIKHGFFMELERRPDVCLKAAEWFRAKQNAVSDSWIKIKFERSKSRDMDRYETVLPIDSELWRDLDTLSKRRLEAWILAVNETTECILRLRYKRTRCYYDYQEEARRKRDVLKYEMENIVRSLKENRELEKSIEEGLFSLERFPLEYARAKMWWNAQLKLSRSRYEEVLRGELKENDADYLYSINEDSKVWKSLDSLSKLDITRWIDSTNNITFELLDWRIYKEKTTARERICSLFFSPEVESRLKDSASHVLPTSLLWDI